MRRPDNKPRDPDEPLLFDLPLAGPGLEDDDEALPLRQRASHEVRDEPPEPPRRGPVPVPDLELEEEDESPVRPAGNGSAGRGRRAAAGLADLMVHAAVLVVALVGCRSLGVRPELARDWPALGVFLLSFSFLYVVLPLAFWGQTLGMAWAGLTSRNRDGEPLTFNQTARRWLGGLLSTAILGLPLLITGSRRSLTDLVSGSATYPSGD
jgi:uncharacterized RDD family membrane protein YckC